MSMHGVGGTSGIRRRATLRDSYHNYGSSKFSLTRMNKSSSTSLRQMVLSYSACDHRSSSSSTTMQNAEWNFGEKWGDVSKPPSLAGSDTSSVETDPAASANLSRTSSQSSLCAPPPPSSSSPSAALRRFYALRKSSMSQQRQRVGGQEDGTWGQFVDVADAEEELVRLSKFLSIRRVATHPRPLSLPCEF